MNEHRQLRLNQKSLHESLFFLLALAIAPLAFGQTPATAPPDEVAVHERGNLLLKQMTLEEKPASSANSSISAKRRHSAVSVRLRSQLFQVHPFQSPAGPHRDQARRNHRRFRGPRKYRSNRSRRSRPTLHSSTIREHFSIGNDELTCWSTARKDCVEEPASFDVWVGGDSTASLHANFNITH